MKLAIIGAVLLGAVAGGAAAKSPKVDTAPPSQLQRLMDCRAIADSVQRLACYDREMAAVDQATKSRELVVVDQSQVRSTRRKLFGFTVPDLGLFGGSDERDEVRSVEGVIAAVRSNADGGVVVTLQDGAVWSQTDSRPIALAPAHGDKVVVRKAALGSFMLSINGQPSVRVQRIG